MADLYQWHRELLNLMLPELEGLSAGPDGEAHARRWFGQLLGRFAERGLKTPAQQKNRVVDTRNAIRKRFGDEHPALAVVGFDEATWQGINLVTHDRTEARNEHQRLLRNPEEIVARATRLLESRRFEDLAVGLAVAVGRRISELLDSAAKLEPVTPWSVRFTGQRKHRGDRESFAFEIPTLVEAERVLDAWGRLRVMLGSERLDPRRINARYSHAVNRAADAHFRGLVPPRLPAAPVPGGEGRAGDPHAHRRRGDALYLHLFRAVYATIAVHWFCPPRVNRILFKAEIQGHRQILGAAENPAMRRSYAASRHYDDYQIADASGENIDGRQGIKLDVFPGVMPLAAFRPFLTTAPATDSEDIEAEMDGMEDPEDDEHTDHQEDADEEEEDHNMKPTKEATVPTLEDKPHAPTDPTGTDMAATTAPHSEEERRQRPGLYRVHVADRGRLDGFRAHPEQSQADNLHGVIEAAAESAQLREELRVLTAAAARAGTLEAERDEARRETDRLRGIVESKATSCPSATLPATEEMLGLAQELLDVAATAGNSPLQPRLLGLASRALGVLGAPGRRTTSAADPTSAETEPERGRPPVEPAANSTPEPGGSDAEGSSEGLAPAAPVPHPVAPAPPPRAARRSGGATAKIATAVAAVVCHNEAQGIRAKKWAITAGAIATLTGCFRPAINRFFDENREEIETHNLKHHVSRGDNGARGRRGEQIEGDIVLK